MENEGAYFQFPLFLLRNLLTDKEKVLNDIICYGLFSFAEKMNFELSSVAKQLMYCYYRDTANLTKDLRNLVETYIERDKIEIDECYCGFSDDEFNPETAIEQILELFRTDNKFKVQAIELYKIRQSYKFIGVTGNYKRSLEVGKRIQTSIQVGEPMPMMNKSQLFEFRDNDKTEIELMQFAVNIAIRSILGKKPYCKTNKEMILCRAFGYSSNKHLPETMPELYFKYLKRYHFDKVKLNIELGNWNIMFYSHQMRGLYVGLKNKITRETLAEVAETKNIKSLMSDKSTKTFNTIITRLIFNAIQSLNFHYSKVSSPKTENIAVDIHGFSANLYLDFLKT